MMLTGESKLIMKFFKHKRKYALLISGLLLISVLSILCLNFFEAQIDPHDCYGSDPYKIQRLMSFSHSTGNGSKDFFEIKHSISSLTTNYHEKEKIYFSFLSDGIDSLTPTFKINNQYDVSITDYYPKAMEINASHMIIMLNFTIGNAPWFGAPEEVIQNLTLKQSATSDTYLILNDSYLSWTPLPDDKYSLLFELNDTVLSKLDLGDHDLYIFTSVYGHNSFDSVPLPMIDLKITISEVIPPQFNNLLDTDQFFSITISAQEFDGSQTNFVEYLPKIFNEFANNINPNITIISTTSPGASVQLNFIGFIGTNSTGEWVVNASISGSIDLTPFDDGLHNLSVRVTSPLGITDYGLIDYFEAKGQVLLVILDEIIVGSYPARKYTDLTNTSQDEVLLRVNIGETIILSYYIFDNGTQTNETSSLEIGYQDPNEPENRFAILFQTSTSDGTGSLPLSADEITTGEGYEVLLYVKGHRPSQQEHPSKITIRWDRLLYDYTYGDETDIGTKDVKNPKALGVDINHKWSLNLSIVYESDRTPAAGAQISYRISEPGWQDLFDNDLDGTFSIYHTHNLPEFVSFECNIISGSPIDPQGYLFVNKTADAASFSLTIVWSYIIVEMIPSEADARIGTSNSLNLSLNAYWAHNYSNFNGNIIAKDEESAVQKKIIMEDGEGIWLGLVKTGSSSYRYSIVRIEDDSYGITEFTNITGFQPVFVDIVWDDIIFTFSDSYDPEKDVISQDWGVRLFFTNFGEDTTLYCHAYHTYDNASFNGTGILYDFTNRTSLYPLYFENGVANWTGDRTSAYKPVRFRVLRIASDPSYGILAIRTSDSNDIRIVWDKIIITLLANQTYSHGSWVDVSVLLEYEVLKSIPADIAEYVDFEIPIDPTKVRYDLLLENGSVHENISWKQFSAFSLSTAALWFNVTDMIDIATGLTKFKQWYQWLDLPETEPEEGLLEIFWIDDQRPTILELLSYDLGNGTILIIIDATDNSETWIGTGINSVQLFDARPSVDLYFPLEPTHIQLDSDVHRFIFTYHYNQLMEGAEWVDNKDFFQFVFNEELLFRINITDNGRRVFPEFLGPLRNPQRLETGTFTITADYDPFKPQFIEQEGKKINMTYLTVYNSKDPTGLREGTINVTAIVRDSTWSGLNENSVQIIIINQNNQTQIISMDLIGDLEDERDELWFTWQGNLTVFGMYHFNFTVTDNAGNTNSYWVEEEIEDYVAPRILDIDHIITPDRKIELLVVVEEAGLGVDYITIQIGSQEINLTRSGGSGAQPNSLSETYSVVIPTKIEPDNIITPKSYKISIIVADKAGNIGNYSWEELKDIWRVDSDLQLPPIIFNPYILLIIGIVLVVMIVVGIRITSKTVGYDMNKILSESEKISREVILTQMDEFALGVTVNFFDQVQGPVPVIWEPPLLEDQEQIMLDLSDKSFSTLEFVGLEETERSGTFDFSTGSYECTALGYSFAIANPEARGGKENLTVVLLLRKEWGDHLLVFQDELLEQIRELREMIEGEKASSEIAKKARELREFVSRLMISFNKLYIGTDYESDLTVE